MSALLEQLDAAAKGALAAGASDAEVSHAARTLGMTRFANSALTQSGVVEERTTRVRVAVGERVGAATTSGLDPAALAQATRQALDAARMSPPSPGFHGFVRPGAPEADRAPLPARGGFVEATRAFGPADRAQALVGVFARAAKDRLTCAGSFVTAPRTLAVATAGGVAREHHGTEASLAVIALDGDASGHANFFGPDVTRLDPLALADAAADKAARSRDAAALEPGAYDVVLMPAAVCEMLEWLSMASFTGRALIDGGSLLEGKRGEPLCDPRITISDDAGYLHPSAVSCPFDCEGTTRERVSLIDAGRGGDVATDLQTGSRLDRPSSGHAADVAGFFGDAPQLANMVLAPGPDSVDELVSRVERGLFVTRFHYVNGLLDTRKAVMTGMTRDGTFLIEDGRVGGGVRNLRWTDSILDALSPARLGGIGKDLAAVPTTWIGAGAYLAPALLLRGFRFTGKSR